MSSTADRLPHPPAEGLVPVEELARRQGVQPVSSVDDLARDDVFETDAELDEFLTFVTALRHADMSEEPSVRQHHQRVHGSVISNDR
jgi:hypothetical protein